MPGHDIILYLRSEAKQKRILTGALFTFFRNLRKVLKRK
jgi:hypothetical protein